MLDSGRYGEQLRPLLGRAGGYARSLLGNRHDAEDAVQQAALRGWERIGQYDASRPFGGWWFAILRNCCLDLLRARKSARTESLDDVDPPDMRGVESLDWHSLYTGLQKVSEAHREILRLRYFAGLTYAELAEALSIPPGTVMSRLHLARKALLAHFGEANP